MGSFYVYLHRRETDNVVFYVGKGIGRRAYYFSERNDHWTKTFKKHGCTVEIFAKGLTEKQAFDIESEQIKIHRSKKLCNKTDGGEGVSGYRFTKEQIKRLSESHKGKVVSEESRRKISESKKGRVNPPHVRELHRRRMIGNKIGSLRKITPELRTHLSEANKGANSHIADKNIYTFAHKDGRVFKGTRYELKDNYGDCVRALFYTKPNKSIYGWSLKIDP